MEKLHSYEQYSEVLAEFKKDKVRCSTNKLLMQDEVAALIDAGKLFYETTEGVLWFFVNEGYFYSANFYVPADTPIRMHKQDMDVLVELTGNQSRYNEQWEQELIAAGYEKGDMYLEYAAQTEDIIDTVREQDDARSARLDQKGFFYRKGTTADYPELQEIWEERLDKKRYTLSPMTRAEWEEIENYGRCDVICAHDGRIVATYLYARRNKIASAYHAAALHQGQGLGTAVFYRLILSAYEEGCTKFACWIRQDNTASIRMHQKVLSPTGKFYRQFILRASDTI